jgi:riboflavin synthase
LFTGLIQHIGVVRAIVPAGEGARLAVELGPLAAHSVVGDSISCNGCCLTIATLSGGQAEFDAVPETLRRTTLGALRPGSRLNLEAALTADKPLGGHFVQGHVDGVAVVTQVKEQGGWVEMHFRLENSALAEELVEKGSIALDGVSLTLAGCASQAATFWVALIPETLARTTLGSKKPGTRVNVETDILGKYVLAALKRRGAAQPEKSNITEDFMREHGYGR